MDSNTVYGGSAAQAPPAAFNTTVPQAPKKFRNEKKRPIGKKPAPTRDVSQERVRAHIQGFVAVWTHFSEDEKTALTRIFSSNPSTLSAKTHTFVYGSPRKALVDRVTKPVVKDPAQEAEWVARKAAKVEKRKTQMQTRF